MSKYLNPKADLTKERAAYTPAELEAYNKYWLDISTERSALAQSRAEGVAEGEAKERAKAQAEKLEMARKMKAKNYPIEDISEMTGLSAEEIAEL